MATQTEQFMGAEPFLQLSEMVGAASVQDLYQHMQLLSQKELEELRDSLEIMALHSY